MAPEENDEAAIIIPQNTPAMPPSRVPEESIELVRVSGE